MSPLEQHAEIVFFDIRGCGRSQRLKNLGDLHVSHVVEDIRHLIAYLGNEPCDVLGFSFGGRIGLELLSRYQELVTRFVLASSSAYPVGSGSPVVPKEIESLQNTADVRRWALESVNRDVWRVSARQKAREVIGRVEFSTRWLNAIQEGFSVSCPDRDYSDDLREADVPVLILHGEYDQQFDVKQAARLAAELPRAELEIIRDAGHLAHMDAPEEWNAAIAKFVEAG